MGVTHATAATGTDSGDGKISKNAWNEDHVAALDDLDDVNAPSPADGDALVWDDGASEWVAAPMATALADLTDVDLTGLANGKSITYNQSTGHWNPASLMANPMTASGDMIYLGSLGANVCPGKTVTESGSVNGGGIYVNDGNYGEPGWRTNGNPGPWFKIDLGTSMSIAAYQYWVSERTQYFDLKYSDDNTNWNTAWQYRGTPGWGSFGGVRAISGGPVSGRYWLHQTVNGGNDWAQITELELYPPASPARLGVGADGKILKVASSAPSWADEFDATAPTTQAFGDSASVGSAATAAHRDHKHGMMGAPTIRQAAGVPSGAPTGTELPIAFDTTASTGGLYVWSGAAWVKASTIP